MSDNAIQLKSIKNSLRFSRDPSIKRKLSLFQRALELGNVARACQEVGKRPRYYYYWWRRFQKSGFQHDSLRALSRRPKRSPRQTPDEVVKLIKAYRRAHGYHPEALALHLEREKKIKVSKATVYRILKRSGLPLKTRPRKSKSPPSDTPTPSAPRTRREPTARSQPASILPVRVSTASPSKTIGQRFITERILGMGGGGIVYLARDQRKHKAKVALKVLEWQGDAPPALVASIRNEFSALSALNHPNLAKVFDFGESAHAVYFSSEWINGHNILEVCRQANLNTVFQLLVQTLRALDYLHARGILHLDLKPENILVTPDTSGESYQIKLIDFGTAEWRKKGTVFQGEFVGTPPYASPEIIMEHAPSTRSDIYSLGMICYQIFAGRFPFVSQDPFEMMKEQIYGEAVAVDSTHPALPESFAAVLARMVEKNPGQRFAGARDVLEALNRSLDESFSWHERNAPAAFLAGCEEVFRKPLFEELLTSFTDPQAKVICLASPNPMGKSFLVKKLKETLQLRHIHPWLVEDAKSLHRLLENPPAEAPVFVDIGKDYPEDWTALFNRLENLGLPVLLTVPFAPSGELNPQAWREVQPLNFGEIEDFLRSEIADFPEAYAIPVATLSRGWPSELERILRAMREEAWLQWGEQGWRWVTDLEPDFARLLPDDDARWQRRLAELVEILHYSSVPINAATLEGMLGIESGWLVPRLEDWRRRGLIASQKIKGDIWYRRTATDPGPPPQATETWNEKKLAELYQDAHFSAGAKLAETLLAKREDLSVSLRLQAARNIVAAGLPDRALEILKTIPEESIQDAPLYFEIEGRSRLNRGDAAAAIPHLVRATEVAARVGDASAESRANNLLGLAERGRQNQDAARRYFEAAIEHARHAGDDYAAGLALMNLGNSSYDQGKFDEAQEFYDRALVLEAKLRHPQLSCRLRENRLNLFFHSGKNALARKSAYDLLQASLRHRDIGAQAFALDFLGLLESQESRHERQLQYLNQAIAILDPNSQRQAYFQCLNHRTHAHLALKKYTAAQLDAEESLELIEKSSQANWIALAHLSLGRVLRDRPRPDLAASAIHLNRAHELVFQAGIAQILWEVEFDRGHLAKLRGELDRAQNYFRSAARFLDAFLDKLPESWRRNYQRNRQHERIAEELKELEAGPE